MMNSGAQNVFYHNAKLDLFRTYSFFQSKMINTSINIFVETADTQDIWETVLVVTWTLDLRKYRIEINQAKLGPARVQDFHNEFRKELEIKYPELLL